MKITLSELFNLMVQSFPIANWYPDEISEIREMVNASSNLPLAFEDLKEGMWVWDNLRKRYYQIKEAYDFRIYHTSWMDGILPEEYDKDRFYRKQVEE